MHVGRPAPGDLVELDHKGRRFHAEVTSIDGQRLAITPLCAHHTWRAATTRELVGLWRASKATRAQINADEFTADERDVGDRA